VIALIHEMVKSEPNSTNLQNDIMCVLWSYLYRSNGLCLVSSLV